MRNLFAIVFVLLAGCGTSIPASIDASFEDRPLEPCGSTRRVVFDATVPVGAITIELWIESGTRDLDDCFARNPDPLLYSMSCSAELVAGEQLGFRVLVNEMPLCRPDALGEESVGTISVYCGSELLAFERIPHPVDGCTYVIIP